MFQQADESVKQRGSHDTEVQGKIAREAINFERRATAGTEGKDENVQVIGEARCARGVLAEGEIDSNAISE